MSENTPAAANLFTIPQTEPFLLCLAKAVLAGDLPHAGVGAPDPLALTNIHILLPSRRACRSLQDCFIEIAGSSSILLPQIRPLGDVDEVLALASPFSPLAEQPELLRPAVPELERRLLLTEFVRAWSEKLRAITSEAGEGPLPVTSLAQATALARELMELMDEAELEGADLDKVHDLGGDFAEHWELTVGFLKIITEQWPNVMQVENQMTAVARRDLLIRAEAARLEAEQPSHPVILAGEVGGVAATGALMQAVAGLPNGAVVLPGLDRLLDEDSWNAIIPDHPEHPQFGLKQFLDRFQMAPAQVPYVAGTAPQHAQQARLKLISETMRPARTTHNWRQLFGEGTSGVETLKTALAHYNLIEAQSEQEEAEVIALILRHAAESPDTTAALVTPDRQLGRRVFARMEKWGLLIDDSGGDPLTRSAAGTFSDLVIETVGNDFSPSTLLALLKHPLMRLKRPVGEIRKAARALELLALRQHRLEDGLYAIKRNLQRSKHQLENFELRHPVVRRLKEDDMLAAELLLADLEEAFKDLINVFRRHEKLAMREFAELHKAALLALAAAPIEQEPAAEHTPKPDLFGAANEQKEEAGEEGEEAEYDSSALWAGEAGAALQLFFDGLLEQTHPAQTTAREYAGLYHSLMADQIVRNRLPVHPRLSLWGPMEARLLSADIVILGALNEGSWPQPADADAWLSRPMRTEVGLPSPERKIGRSAHDMAQVLGANKVYMTRATKIDGVPSVPSRWLLRLKALAAGAELSSMLPPIDDQPWLQLARLRDTPKAEEKIGRPNPAPPVSARPRRLSVTKVEQWITNPYAIFARHILDLEPLPPLGREPDAAMRGQIIHTALHQFSKLHELQLPQNSGEVLVGLTNEMLDQLGDHPRILAFWKPQFARFAEWFGETEPGRRENLVRHIAEHEGRMSLEAHEGDFLITARADRLDLDKDGRLSIYDYKSKKMMASNVRRMMSPQLPLEAAIALAGGFAELGKVEVADLIYISVTGREERGLETVCTNNDYPASQLADDAVSGLKTLVNQYDNPEVGYPSLRRAGFSYMFDDYEHLARVKEWAVEDD